MATFTVSKSPTGQERSANKSTNFVKADQCVLRLLQYCEERNWGGHDPYDVLNSQLLATTPFLKSRWFRIVATQALKRLPINLRPLLGVPESQNPKALGLFLMAFLKLSRQGLLRREELINIMIDRLIALRSPSTNSSTNYWCWGYSFPWQTRTVIVPRWAPNIVCTSFVANALLDTYEAWGKLEHLRMAISAGEYIVSTLYWTDNDGTSSFSYPLPGLKSRVHNANFLAAAILCRLHRHGGGSHFLDAALRSARYSARQQREDGAWAYGEQGTQGWVDHFHTGYNLCALRQIGLAAETVEFEPWLERGFQFYRRHFFGTDGAPKYFHNRVYPLDVHSAAQSLITLVSLSDLATDNVQLAEKVWEWTYANIWDPAGYFYYEVHPYWINRISYMRWSQAWMLLALATVLTSQDKMCATK